MAGKLRLGKVLRRWRTFEDIGVREAAKRLGVSSATLSRIETGRMMDSETLLKIINWLMAEE